jgi:uncharacterized protein YeaO (DUF488 family)
MADRFRVKRAYDEASPDDGRRVLVDRLWPRGVTKEHARLDEWAKYVGPSTALRQWFHEDPESRYPEFAARYAAELDEPERRKAVDDLRAEAAKAPVTLVTGVKDLDHSHIRTLLDRLDEPPPG